MKLFVLVFFIILPFTLSAQGLRVIFSDGAGQKIKNVGIYIKGDSNFKGISDSSGTYLFKDLIPGFYTLVYNHTDFTTDSVQNIHFVRGKQIVLPVQLSQRHISLNQVSVFDVSDYDTYSNEESKRYPAAFADPGRLATFSASTFTVDDQANHVSVRGNFPFQNKWFVDGLEVLNPNHLENAGTLSDRPGSSGGGVNIFSTLVMDNSRFMKGVLPVAYSNTSGGLFDIKLREGNDEVYENTIQASLLGTEVSSEGPLKKYKSSYLVNARYSTVGLLSLAGVNFGEEKIDYYDLTAIFKSNIGKNTIKYFMIAGSSKNIHEIINDTSEAASFKDFQDIRYSSNTAIGGATVNRKFNLKHSASVSIAGSYKLNERTESGLFGLPNEERTEKGMLTYKLQGRSFSSKTIWRYGLSGNFIEDLKSDLTKSIFIPFISGERTFGRFSIDAGISVFMIPEKIFPDPRLGFRFTFSGQHDLILRGGSRTQQLFGNEFTDMGGLLNSKDAELAYQVILNSVVLKSVLFYQKVTNYFYSELPANYLETKGVELTAERKLRKYDFLLAASVFDAGNAGSAFNNNVYDYGIGANLYVGRQIRFSSFKILNIDARTHYHRGGIQSLFDYSGTFLFTSYSRLPDYYRTDLRISYIRTKRFSSMWFIDIQNLFSRKNTSGYYYDPFLKTITTKHQLGIIPVLGYRIDF